MYNDVYMGAIREGLPAISEAVENEKDPAVRAQLEKILGAAVKLAGAEEVFEAQREQDAQDPTRQLEDVPQGFDYADPRRREADLRRAGLLR